MERRRLEGIEVLGVLQPDAAPALERIVRIASAITGAASAGIHIIDEVSQIRVAGHNASAGTSSRTDSMCRLTVEGDRPVVTGDATTDARFAYSSYITGPDPVRFYASTPLRNDLYGPIGTVCVWDTLPRAEPHHHLDALADLAELAIEVLETRRRVQVLSEAAMTDELTDLPNRRMVYDTLSRAIRRRERDGSPVTVAYIDLDGFKAINDTDGHEVGDAVLSGVAANLRAVARADEVVGRVGGDEFVVVAGRGLDTLEALGRYGEAIERHVDTDAGPRSVGASIGIASVTDGDSADSVLRRADRQMFQVKRDRGQGREG